MIQLSKELATVLMLGTFTVAIFTGFPLGFIIGSVGLIFGYIFFGNAIGKLLYDRMVDGVLMNYVFLAVPLFIFMGAMMEYSGMTERLYDALYLWIGGLPGGIALITMTIGIVIGGPIGIVAASVSMLGVVGLPTMIKRGYNKALAAGTVAAGGTLGILIPPSIMFVVYGPMAGISAGKLFFAAFMPGFLLSALYLFYIFAKCWLQPELAPRVQVENVPFAKKTWMLVTSLVPPTFLMVAVLGVIFFGVATTTEAAGIGALATTLLVIAERKFSLKILKTCSLETFKTCGFVLLIVIMGFGFTGVFIRSGADEVFANVLLATPGGKWGVFAAIMFLCFTLGFFIDWIGIVFILVAVVTPIADKLGFDPVWFAMMMCINFQMEFMTPPMAMAIFIVHGIAPKELGISMNDCINGVWPFVFLIIVGILLCIAFPEIITWLPNVMIK
jgi:tripartite ATP-independent transporter DctM subunit